VPASLWHGRRTEAVESFKIFGRIKKIVPKRS
jgi:hypothetical protein